MLGPLVNHAYPRTVFAYASFVNDVLLNFKMMPYFQNFDPFSKS